MSGRLSCLVLALALVGGTSALGQGWEWVSPLPEYPLVGMAWDGQKLLAVDRPGGIYYGDEGVSCVWASADGTSWKRTWCHDRALRALACGGGTCVAVGDGILSSPDGVSWTPRAEGVVASLRAVVWAGSRFVAVGEGAVAILTSADGVTWTGTALAVGTRLETVAANAGVTIAAGFNWSAGSQVLRSENGGTWTPVTLPGAGGASEIIWAGDRFLAVGGENHLLSSPDGASWSDVGQLPWSSRRRLAWNGSLLLAFWDGVWTSPDGVTWTERIPSQEAPDSEVPWSAAWTGQRWVVNGTFTSADGVSWRDWRFALLAVASGGETSVAVGEGGVILSSSNGVDWVRRDLPTAARLGSVTWTGEGFVAAGERTVVASPDGVMWQVGATGLDADVRRVSWNGSRHVAVLADGGLATSPDGLAWSRVAGVGGWVEDVAAAGWKQVAVGRAGLVLTSRDGVRWDRVVAPVPADLLGVTWTGRSFVAVGAGPTLLRSPDGEHWTAMGPPRTPASEGSTVERLVAVHSEGERLTVWGEAVAPEGWRSPWCWDSSDGTSWLTGDTLAAGGGRALARTAEHLTLVAGPGILRQPRLPRRIVVPTSAHVAGINGTFWRSEVEVVNRGTEVARYELALLPRAGGRASASPPRFTLQPGAAARHRDLLQSVLGATGAGAVRVTALVGQVEVTSRTFTASGTGSFGQAVPGIPEEEAATAGRTVRLVSLSQAATRADGFRTNLGVVNTGQAAATIDVALHAASGAVLGAFSETVQAGALVQIDEVLRRVTPDPVAGGYALLRTMTPGASFLAYASVIDNRTGDPVLIVAR